MEKSVIFLSAAEVSGDMHAAKLIEAIRRRRPDARLVGIGGPEMEAAGCEIIEHTVHRSAMLGGAVRGVFYFASLIRRTARAMAQLQPVVHVPVDSPALNWHLAKAARKNGVPVMYYIAPQVWAWAPWRIRKVRALTDAVACILPFEQEYFRKRGVNARFVGHPLLDRLDAASPPDIQAAFASGRLKVAMLPGSRGHEISGHIAAMAQMMDRIGRKFPRAEFTFAAADESAAGKFREFAGRSDLPIEVGRTDAVLADSHFALVASGTATLEAAHFGVPMVIVHRGSWLGYNLVARWLITTPYLSLVNILAGEELAPELMPWYGDIEPLWRAVEGLLDDPAKLMAQRKRLLELVGPLHIPGGTAADRAAEMVLDVASKRTA